MPADGTESRTKKILKKSGTGDDTGAAVQPDPATSFLSIEAEEPSLRAGKDEMNLAEYPFALLKQWGRQDRAVLEIEHEHRHHRTGKMIQANWRVTGDPELGLPGPLEERLYMVLMELTREQGMAQEVYFSFNDLLRRLGWPHNQRYYEKLDEAFTRLKNVNVDAKNAFWCPTLKDYYGSVKFNLIDEVRIIREPPGRRAQGQLPTSFFRWHNVVYASIQDGYVRSVDTGFALSLDLPLALRLFRYLDRHRHGKDGQPRGSFEIGLKALCEVHLGMAPSPYPSKHKERLAPAHEELIRRGFIVAAQYEPMKTRDGEKVTYAFPTAATHDNPPALPASTSAPAQPSAPAKMMSAPLALPAPVPVVETLLAKLRRTTGIDDMELRRLCKTVFDGLPDDLRDKVRTEARQGVPDFGWARLEDPEAVLSVALWELIARDFPNELDLALHHTLAQRGGPKGKRGARRSKK